MKTNCWLFSLRITRLVFFLLIWTIDLREAKTVLNDCDINRYIEYLHTKWRSNSWPKEMSSRCIGHILLQWAYQLRGALDGDTTMEMNRCLDEDPSNLEAKCDPSLKHRTNRSSLDALQDVFSLLLKLSSVLKEGVDQCSLISIHDHDTFFNQTLTLVRTMNCFVRRQNGLVPNNQIVYGTEPLCEWC